MTGDLPAGIDLPLPSRRNWPIAIVLGVTFAIFAAIAVTQIGAMRGRKPDTVFDLMFILFQGFWVIGWSVGVLLLFLLTVLVLFYRESARIADGRLIHRPGLGPLRLRVEYDLAKIRNLRVETAGSADQARIRFDYGEGEKGLGSAMPRAQAEALVRAMQPALPFPAGTARGGPDRDPGRAEPARVAMSAAGVAERGTEPQPWISTSSLALVGANLVPLAGVLLFGWDLGEVMILFWAENAVIGFYNLLKIGVVAKWGALLAGPFFVGHYGGFMAAHFLFVYYLFVRGIGTSAPEAPVFKTLAGLFVPLWPALVSLAVSHGISFRANFLGRKEYLGRSVSTQMGEPYKRVMILHVTLIFAGWVILLLKNPLPALVFLIVLKTIVDLQAHRKERSRSA